MLPTTFMKTRVLARKCFILIISHFSRIFNRATQPHNEVISEKYLEKNLNNNNQPIKLLYVALKYDYGDVKRGFSYEEHTFLKSIERNREINFLRFDYYSVAAKYGNNTANEILKSIIIEYKPQKFLFFLYKDLLNYEDLAFFKNIDQIETIIWLFDDDKRYDETKKLTRQFDTVVTTIKYRHEQRLKLGFNSKLAQFGVNHHIFSPINIERSRDVVFIGQNFGNRAQYINYLLRNKIKVETYGLGWRNGRISQSQMLEILSSSKIVLNFSSSHDNPHLKFIKGRIFEITAMGATLLTEKTEDLDDFFIDGEEYFSFQNENELLAKITTLLKDDALRTESSIKAQHKSLTRFTIDGYLSKIIGID